MGKRAQCAKETHPPPHKIARSPVSTPDPPDTLCPNHPCFSAKRKSGKADTIADIMFARANLP